ncbi:MAG: TIGR02530 family flagellar biosynthesis protein [Planctomycetota bacterium]|jgi:flagellar operon protein
MVRQVAATGPRVTGAVAGPGRKSAVDFRDVLRQARERSDEVRLSAHAAERLRQRNISLTAGDMARVSAAAERLASKGGRDALVVMDGVGLILDVRNRTVVTAIEQRVLQENVFTNIDSAAFA